MFKRVDMSNGPKELLPTWGNHCRQFHSGLYIPSNQPEQKFMHRATFLHRASRAFPGKPERGFPHFRKVKETEGKNQCRKSSYGNLPDQAGLNVYTTRSNAFNFNIGGVQLHLFLRWFFWGGEGQSQLSSLTLNIQGHAVVQLRIGKQGKYSAHA